MNKKSIFFLLCLLVSAIVQAQNYKWTKTFGSSSFDLSFSFIVSASSDVYSTGYFRETADFDPGVGFTNLTSAGLTDIFIQKMDSSGNLIWVKTFGSSGDDIGYSIDEDRTGNVYVSGSFTGTVDFDPGSGLANLTAAGRSDAFILKLDASGNFIWAKSFGNNFFDVAQTVIVGPLGNIHSVGSFAGTVDFDPGTGIDSISSNGSFDVYVHKMDAAGNYMWTRTFGGNSMDQGRTINIDKSGNIYTSGIFSGTVDFDPSTGIANHTSLGSSDVYVQKMDINGNFLWAETFGGANSEVIYPIVNTDDLGNVYTIGRFSNTIDLNPGSGSDIFTATGFYSLYIRKMDSTGNFLWAKTYGGSRYDAVNGYKFDALGNIYTCGSFSETMDIDPDTGVVTLTSNGETDFFVQKLNSSGKLLWAQTLGSKSFDFTSSIDLDSAGFIYITGSFGDTLDFNPGAATNNIIPVGGYDIFVHKITQGNISKLSKFQLGFGIEVIAYPNPSYGLVQVSFSKPMSGVEITLTDLQGKVLESKQVNAGSNTQIEINSPPGMYLLMLKSSQGQSVIKILKK